MLPHSKLPASYREALANQDTARMAEREYAMDSLRMRPVVPVFYCRGAGEPVTECVTMDEWEAATGRTS